jgi:hypothetical protein
MGIGGRLKKMGGGEKGLDWCMTKAGVRYNRIPDPAHVLSARGWARGKGRKADNHRKRCPIKNVYSRNITFLVPTRWDPV